MTVVMCDFKQVTRPFCGLFSTAKRMTMFSFLLNVRFQWNDALEKSSTLRLSTKESEWPCHCCLASRRVEAKIGVRPVWLLFVILSNESHAVGVCVLVVICVPAWQSAQISKVRAKSSTYNFFRGQTYHLIYLSYFYFLYVTYYIFLELIFKTI